MLVKKYGNRRLYDTEDSRYVRLGELADKIRRGSDVRIVDATSGADLTAETLVQIIFEDRHAARLLPVSLLLQMIRMGDDALGEFLGRYVTWALDIYLHAKQGAKGFGALSPFSAFSALSPFLPFGGPPPPRSGPEPAEPAAPPTTQSDELAELRRDVEALKRGLKKRSR